MLATKTKRFSFAFSSRSLLSPGQKKISDKLSVGRAREIERRADERANTSGYSSRENGVHTVGPRFVARISAEEIWSNI